MNAKFLRHLNQRPIAYYPIYRVITGSTTAGILLSQLMYWFSKKDKFYKTDAEIIEETFLTSKELKNAKAKIKKLDFIKVTREGIPAKTYYEIDWGKYFETLQKYETNCTSQKGQTIKTEKDNQVSPKGTNCTDQKGQTITKITTENTTKIKTKNKENTQEEKGPIREDEVKEEEPLNKLSKRINDYLLEKGINLNTLKRQELDRILFELKKSYSLEEIEETFLFGLEDRFYKKIVVNPKSFFNNFESIKIELENQKQEKEKEIIFCGL